MECLPKFLQIYCCQVVAVRPSTSRLVRSPLQNHSTKASVVISLNFDIQTHTSSTLPSLLRLKISRLISWLISWLILRLISVISNSLFDLVRIELAVDYRLPTTDLPALWPRLVSWGWFAFLRDFSPFRTTRLHIHPERMSIFKFSLRALFIAIQEWRFFCITKFVGILREERTKKKRT